MLQLLALNEVTVLIPISLLQDVIDSPIALIKRAPNCTQHPMSPFVSLQNLSPQYRSFLTSLLSQRVPTSVQEALTSKP